MGNKKFNNRPILEKRDQQILSDFTKLFKKGFRTDIIFQKLSDKYFLSERTLTLIVRKEAKQK